MRRRKGGLFHGLVMGTLLGFVFSPRKSKNFMRKLKKEVRYGGNGLNALRSSYQGKGRDIIEMNKPRSAANKGLISRICRRFTQKRT